MTHVIDTLDTLLEASSQSGCSFRYFFFFLCWPGKGVIFEGLKESKLESARKGVKNTVEPL